MTIVNSILKSRPLNADEPKHSPLRNSMRRTLIAVNDLLFDLKNGVVPDDYCYEQLAEIEAKIKDIKEKI